jgi:hypothetical protein
MVEEGDIGAPKTFEDIIQINDEFFMLLANGRVYKLTNIDEKLMSESMVSLNENETCVMNETHLKNVCLECKTKAKLSKKVNCFARIATYEGEMFVIAGDGYLFIVDTKSKDPFVTIPYISGMSRIKKIFNLEDFM